MTQPSELDAQTKARIQAEEAYRAQVRHQQAAQKRDGCLKWVLGILAIPVVLLLVLFTWSKVSPAPPDPKVDFVVNCERLVKAQLKAPDTAKISNAFEDGIMTAYSGYVWNGTVDSQNSFSANVRTTFRCSGAADSPALDFQQ